MMPAAGGPGPSSDLDKLFDAWGIGYDGARVLADAKFQMRLQSGYALTAQTITAEGMNPDNPISSNLSDLLLISPGSFDVSAPEGVEYEALVYSSEQSQMVSSMDADPLNETQVEAVRKAFVPSNEQKAIAIRLSGNFTTAFPDGDPAPIEPAEGEEAPAKPADTALKTSEQPGTVVAIADADFIYDASYMQAQNVMGQQFIQIHHGANLNIFQNSIDLLLGADELIEIRKRASSVRSFDRMNQWYGEAEAKFRDQQAEYESAAGDAQARINAILQQTPDNVDLNTLGPEIEEELRKLRVEEVQISRKVREIRKQVRRDFESRLNNIKMLNIFGCSVLVLIIGVLLSVKRRYSTAAR